MPLIVPTMSDASTNISKRDAPCVPGMRASVGPGMCDASIGPGKNNASLRLQILWCLPGLKDDGVSPQNPEIYM